MNGIVLAWCTAGQVAHEFAYSLSNLLLSEGQPVRATLASEGGPNIAYHRTAITEKFLESQFSHLFFVDSDMSFTPYHVASMAHHAARWPIVGGLARTTNGLNIYDEDADGHFHNLVIGDMPDKGVFSVDGTGAACLMVRREVFEKLGAGCWAELDHNGVRLGEDLSFCVRAREAGYPIHIDSFARFGHVKKEVWQV